MAALTNTPPWDFVYDGVEPTHDFYRVVIVCSERKITVSAFVPQSFSFNVASTYNESFAQGVNSMLPSLGNMDQYSRAFGLQLSTQALTAQMWQGTSEVDFSLRLVFAAESDVDKEVTKPISDLLRLVLPGESTSGGLLESPGPSLDFEKMKAALSDPQTQAELNAGAASLSSAADGTIDAVTDRRNFISKAVNAAGNAKTGVSQVLGAASRAMRQSIKNNITLAIGRDMLFESVVVTSVAIEKKALPLPDGTFAYAEVDVGFKTFYTPTANDIPRMFQNRTGSR